MYTIKNLPDSGQVIIQSETDVRTLATAKEIVRDVLGALSWGKLKSRSISPEDIDYAQARAEVLNRPNLYLNADRCYPVEDCRALFAAALEQHREDGGAFEDFVPPSVVKLEALKDFEAQVKTMELAELRSFFLEDPVLSKAKKATLVKELVDIFAKSYPRRVSGKARLAFGRLKQARALLNYPFKKGE